jgi:hypothetical protein
MRSAVIDQPRQLSRSTTSEGVRLRGPGDRNRLVLTTTQGEPGERLEPPAIRSAAEATCKVLCTLLATSGFKSSQVAHTGPGCGIPENPGPDSKKPRRSRAQSCSAQSGSGET